MRYLHRFLWTLASAGVGFLSAVVAFGGRLRTLERDVAEGKITQRQTLVIVTQLAQRAGVDLTVLYSSGGGVSYARNKGGTQEDRH